MNTLRLTIRNIGENDSFVRVDGETKPLKRKKAGEYELVYETNKPTVHVSVFTFLEYKEKLWWLTSILFFLISLFGILDTHRNRKCRAVALEADLYLHAGENLGQLRLLPWRENRAAVQMETTCPTYVTENCCYVDGEAKKRRRMMRIVKVGLFVVCLLVLVLLLP